MDHKKGIPPEIQPGFDLVIQGLSALLGIEPQLDELSPEGLFLMALVDAVEHYETAVIDL